MSEQQPAENFSTKLAIWDFTLDEQPYRVQEAVEDAIIAYKNVTMTNMHFQADSTDNKTAALSGGAEADAVLISKCLFKLGGDKPQPVSLQFVKGLRRPITKRLYNWIRTNSAMDEEEETEEFLQKRIISDTKKLDAIRGKQTPGKDVSSSTGGT